MDRALTTSPWGLRQDADTTTGPEPKPLRAPVFIHDAVIPWRGETLLLALWREQQGADQEP
ncbi:MAG: hypothetical protein AB3N21_08465 [Ruegeria sp.]|uniref:hypothetical protein n=1 Tax=Ruegeria sp. TaxID=1879320 RepID=UPI00349EA223